MTDAKSCSACGENRPLEQFRVTPAGTRHSWCLGCEREAARIRAAKRYREDPEWRLKQLANASLQHKRRASRERERRRERSTEG